VGRRALQASAILYPDNATHVMKARQHGAAARRRVLDGQQLAFMVNLVPAKIDGHSDWFLEYLPSKGY